MGYGGWVRLDVEEAKKGLSMVWVCQTSWRYGQIGLDWIGLDVRSLFFSFYLPV